MNKILTAAFLLISPLCFAQQANQCIYIEKEDFMLEGREEDFIIDYDCPRNIYEYPYFSQINFRTQQGLRCESDIGIYGVTLTCRNRSAQSRSARSVVLTCCHQQVHGLQQ